MLYSGSSSVPPPVTSRTKRAGQGVLRRPPEAVHSPQPPVQLVPTGENAAHHVPVISFGSCGPFFPGCLAAGGAADIASRGDPGRAGGSGPALPVNPSAVARAASEPRGAMRLGRFPRSRPPCCHRRIFCGAFARFARHPDRREGSRDVRAAHHTSRKPAPTRRCSNASSRNMRSNDCDRSGKASRFRGRLRKICNGPRTAHTPSTSNSS